MFRLLQILDVILILPMIVLGFMAGLSGGGVTPAFQRIGQLMLVVAPIVGIICVIVAEILWRGNQPTAATLVVLIPLAVYVGLVIWLQVATGFFF